MRTGSNPGSPGAGKRQAGEDPGRQEGERRHDPGRGHLAVVGIGPGGEGDLTFRAREVLSGAQIVVGYRTYLSLIEEYLEGKEVIGSGMRREVDRCLRAIEEARSGKRVALVSSGDPGVYGMAGPAIEIGPDPEYDLEIVPGVTAAQKAASLLGAPLMNDYAVISLSDLLTPWEVIEKRLEAAAAADFTVVLYNPRSHGRTVQIRRAREILLRHRGPGTPVGIVRAAGREGEKVTLAELGSFDDGEIDMVTLVIVGCSKTRRIGRYLVTSRGYGGA